MSDSDSTTANTVQEAAKGKIVRERKPKVKPGPGSFRYGPNVNAPKISYGPCSIEVAITSRQSLGDPREAEPIRAFCEALSKFPELCRVRGYGVINGVWTVTADLATDGKDVDDDFISKMFKTFQPELDASPVLKYDFGAGKARYYVLNVGTTVEEGDLN